MSAGADPVVIDLLSDDEEGVDCDRPPVKRCKTVADAAGRVIYCLDESDDDDVDDEATVAFPPDDDGNSGLAPVAVGAPPMACIDPRFTTISGGDDEEANSEVEVAASIAVRFKSNSETSTASSDGEEKKESDDIAVVGWTGNNALMDFPHARENCVTHPQARDPARHCVNCYCYVCDIPASQCKSWNEHCQAKHSEAIWRDLRQQHRSRGGAPPAVHPLPAAQAVTTLSSRALTGNVLRTAHASSSARRNDSQGVSGELSARALLQAVTTVYPVEMSPPSSLFRTNLRHYQKQSLAFMVERERQKEHQSKVRGGWLCDEVGMGKSAVVIALVALNQMPRGEWPTAQQLRAHRRQRHAVSIDKNKRSENTYLKVKTTVVLTSVSLLGQWEDECRRHAPNLRVSVHHPSSNRYVDLEQFEFLDVVISTSTSRRPHYFVNELEFHRVVADESHLFTTAPASAKCGIAMQFCSKQRWCVTATPCTTSIQMLYDQLTFLNANSGVPYNQELGYSNMSVLHSALRKFAGAQTRTKYPLPGGTVNARFEATAAFNDLVEELKKVMIRHTKSQRINGTEALALPSSTTTNIFLDMSAEERRLFGHANLPFHTVRRLLSTGGQTFLLERTFLFQMNQVVRDNPTLQLTKIEVLRRELQELRRTEPTFRVVVFTQYRAVHKFCIEALKKENMSVYQFDGSTAATKRDKAIRQFQSQEDGRPAVFVITLRTGNVGITLTAATRVYLLEPSIDPTAEYQAAGRIHRLGQTSAVQVKKFIFNDTVEFNIMKLHEEVAAARISIRDGFVPPEGVRILAKGIRHIDW